MTWFLRSIQRYLNDKISTINIFKDQAFNKAREVLSAKRKEVVRENAKGNQPQAARELTEGVEDKLFRLGEFGTSNPEALQRTVWWLLSLHFRFRARDKSRRLKWGDVKLCGDPANNNQFLLWQSERGSKTRNEMAINEHLIPSLKLAMVNASGLFSGASIGKINGCTFNIQYVTSDGNNHYNNPASINRRRIFISDDSDSD